MKKNIVLLAAITFSMKGAEIQKKSQPEQKVYQGNIFLFPLRPMLYGTGNHYEGKKLEEAGFKLKSNELIFEIWAYNEECNNWHRDQNEPYKIFPSHLPMSILKDLEEGDEIGFKFKNGFKCIVKASQKKSRYGNNKSFDAMRNELLQVALENGPKLQDNETVLEEMKLIEKGMVDAPIIGTLLGIQIENWKLSLGLKKKYLKMLPFKKNDEN